MSRLLAIDADLSEPPSSAAAFRDVTLYAAIRHYQTVAIAPPDMRAIYSGWFRRFGLWDYVEDILTPAEAAHEKWAVQIEGGPNARLTATNLNAVLALLG